MISYRRHNVFFGFSLSLSLFTEAFFNLPGFQCLVTLLSFRWFYSHSIINTQPLCRQCKTPAPPTGGCVCRKIQKGEGVVQGVRRADRESLAPVSSSCHAVTSATPPHGSEVRDKTHPMTAVRDTHMCCTLDQWPHTHTHMHIRTLKHVVKLSKAVNYNRTYIWNSP